MVVTETPLIYTAPTGSGNASTIAGAIPMESLQGNQGASNFSGSTLITIPGYESLSLPQTTLQLDLPEGFNVGNLQFEDDGISRHHLDGHLDEVQSGLDNLKNLLKEDIALDKSTLMSLFGTDSNDKDSAGKASQASNEASMNLVSYNPSLYELTEDDSLFGYDNDGALLDEELESMLTTDRENLLKVEQTSDAARLNFEG